MRSQVPVAVLVLIAAGCGGGASDGGTPTRAAAEQSPEGSPSPGDIPTVGAVAGNVLIGTVGEQDDPDAFTITLTDSAGGPVSAVPPGEYQIQVNDLSGIHNFRLAGAGVDESTSTPEVEMVTWQVTLQPGVYTFVCDPHSSQMRGSLTVR